jgi:hypothetical protein
LEVTVWVYGLVLVGITVVVLAQLNRLRHLQRAELSVEALQALEDARQALVDAALTRAGEFATGLHVTHRSEYSWPLFTVRLENQSQLDALEAAGGVDALRAAFAQVVADDRGQKIEECGFDPSLGVRIQVGGG